MSRSPDQSPATARAAHSPESVDASPAQSPDTTLQTCAACGAARCTAHGTSKRLMQAHPVASTVYRELTLHSPILGCQFNRATASTEVSDREKLLSQFVAVLNQLGMSQLVNAWVTQYNAGIPPEEMVFSSSKPELLPVVEAEIPASQATDSLTRGQESEERLHRIIRNKKLFPWISEVSIKQKNHSGCDFVLKLADSHPLAKRLKPEVLHLDAKSSLEGVFKYYTNSTRKTAARAYEGQVISGSWAVDAAANFSSEYVYAQLVYLLLITLGVGNQENHWEAVLSDLHPDLKSAFEKHRSHVVRRLQDFFYSKVQGNKENKKTRKQKKRAENGNHVSAHGNGQSHSRLSRNGNGNGGRK